MKLSGLQGNTKEAIFFCLKFLGLLIAFHVLVSDTVLGRWINLWDLFATWSAYITGPILSFVGLETKTYGNILIHGQVSVSVSKGCDGLTASIIYISAVLAFRAPILAKTLGALVGFAAIQAINILRIIILFLTLIYFPDYFDDMHMYAMQAFVITFGVVLWFYWAQRYAKITTG